MTTKSPPKYKDFFNMLKVAVAANMQLNRYAREVPLVKKFKFIHLFQVSVSGYAMKKKKRISEYIKKSGFFP